LVAQVRNCQDGKKNLRKLLTTAFDDLPPSAHLKVVTIPGIGEATAAILVAKIVDIDRFETASHLVGYFGIFPAENSSGVNKLGQPLPTGTKHMSQKGNDLARSYLWNAARVAIRCNPAIAPLYRRLRSRGKRGDVAMGHCMRKLLHLVYAVWKTDRPFDENHFPWEGPSDAQSSTSAPPAVDAGATAAVNKKAVGHKRDLPAEKVVTTANSTVEPAPGSVKPAPQRTVAGRPKVDFAYLREQITMQQVLEHLSFFASLRGSGQQRRGPCPIHSQPGSSERTFSVHLGKGAFQCFQADCGLKGNVLDLWAAIHDLPLYEAALHLAGTFQLALNREEEPVRGTRTS
jgi:hypothetical protein